MRVLYFHQHFSTRSGAGGTRSFEFARALLAAGHEVTMVCGSNSKAETGLRGPFRRGRRRGRVEGIDVIEFDLPYGNEQGLASRAAIFAAYALRAAALAITTPADVVYASSTPLTAAVPGMCARWLRRRRFVFEVRDLWPELPAAMGVIQNRWVLRALSALERASYRSAQVVVGLSPGICDGVRRVDAHADVAMIPNGCDLDLFEPMAREPGATLRAVFCGAHGRANGLDSAIAAAALLEQENEPIELHLIGRGSEKGRLQQLAAELGLSSVVFHEPLPKIELSRRLGSFDVGLMLLDDVPAFHYGTSPNKFFDYISAGLPVVVNHPGWIGDMIGESSLGMVTRDASPEALASALIEFRRLTDDDRHEMGLQSRSLAERHFDRLDLARRFVSVLEGVVSRAV